MLRHTHWISTALPSLTGRVWFLSERAKCTSSLCASDCTKSSCRINKKQHKNVTEREVCAKQIMDCFWVQEQLLVSTIVFRKRRIWWNVGCWCAILRILKNSGVRRFPLKETNSLSELKEDGFACKHPLAFKMMQDEHMLHVLYSMASCIPIPLEKGVLCQQTMYMSWEPTLLPENREREGCLFSESFWARI